MMRNVGFTPRAACSTKLARNKSHDCGCAVQAISFLLDWPEDLTAGVILHILIPGEPQRVLGVASL